ncbi:hypothetical protein PFISCL1PPCAC_6720 [Pristionchus fissidentatus]|uniref:GYF domain-containing protein n=1 Tax=Pristionchus fissidentatus TaxID=1538716 RepID=A0AAV5V898_9BILA|nr:hypothetical protein PFISCL1PPCAC_6720 [Pristionchus fissidentatus]
MAEGKALAANGIYYRDPDYSLSFYGPFTEQYIQTWYQQGYFYSRVEFRFGTDGKICTLETLREFNGTSSPFAFLIDSARESELEKFVKKFELQLISSSFVHKQMTERNKELAEKVNEMQLSLDRAMERQRQLEERLDQLEKEQETSSETSDTLEEEDHALVHKRNDDVVRWNDKKFQAHIEQVNYSINSVNVLRYELLSRVRSLETTSVGIPWIRSSPDESIDDEMSEVEIKCRQEYEKKAERLMWNASKMLGHGSALVDYDTTHTPARAGLRSAFRDVLKGCHADTKQLIVNEWERLVDFSNVKCLLCRCSMNDAEDFMDHLMAGPHISILKFCKIDSECVKFFTKQILDHTF